MTDELDYEAIFGGLNQARVDFVVVGGLAVNFHGIPRMTYDIDLMIQLEPVNISRLIERLAGWGYRAKAPVDPRALADAAERGRWVREKNMRAFSFWSDRHPVAEIDILLESPVSYKEVRQRAVVMTLGEETVQVVSLPDLIEMKRETGREQDRSDIEHLETVQRNGKVS